MPPGRCDLRCPAIVFQGTADTTVDASNAVHLIRSLAHGTQGRVRYRLTAGSAAGRRHNRFTLTCPGATDQSEVWLVESAQHAWFGGDSADLRRPLGPDASEEMLRFFLARAGADTRRNRIDRCRPWDKPPDASAWTSETNET